MWGSEEGRLSLLPGVPGEDDSAASHVLGGDERSASRSEAWRSCEERTRQAASVAGEPQASSQLWQISENRGKGGQQERGPPTATHPTAQTVTEAEYIREARRPSQPGAVLHGHRVGVQFHGWDKAHE